MLLFGLNSVLETRDVNDFARGGVGRDQLGVLNAALLNANSAVKSQRFYEILFEGGQAPAVYVR